MVSVGMLKLLVATADYSRGQQLGSIATGEAVTMTNAFSFTEARIRKLPSAPEGCAAKVLDGRTEPDL
jgi:hypothetical protein